MAILSIFRRRLRRRLLMDERLTCRIGRRDCATSIGRNTAANRWSTGILPVFQSIHRVDDVGAGLLVVLEFDEAAVLGLKKQFIESAKTVGALVESRILPF